MLHEGTRSNLSGSLAETGSFSKDSWKGWRPGSWDTWLHDMWRCLIPLREFMRIQQLQVRQKEGFARKKQFLKMGFSNDSNVLSLFFFKLKYDIPADAHWNLEPIPISAERVPSPTYHTIWSISGRVWIAALLQQIHSLSASGDGDRHAGLECSSLSRTAGGMRFGLSMISRSSRDLPSFRI